MRASSCRAPSAGGYGPVCRHRLTVKTFRNGFDLRGAPTTRETSVQRGACFGYTAEEAVGRSVSMLIPPDNTDEEPSILASLRRGEQTSIGVPRHSHVSIAAAAQPFVVDD